jgi:hypothetical protein
MRFVRGRWLASFVEAEERNLVYPSHADEPARALQQTMLGLLNAQLAAKRLTPSAGERPGYRPPATG